MLLGDLSRANCLLSLPPVFARLCAKLKALDLSQLPLGWQDLEAGIRMNVMEFETTSPKGKKAEIHRKFIDIQLVITGEEMIEYSLSQPDLSLYDEYREEDDYQLAEVIENANKVVLKSNMFAIFLTNEPHKPGNFVENSQFLRKLVVKVPMELLGGE